MCLAFAANTPRAMSVAHSVRSRRRTQCPSAQCAVWILASHLLLLYCVIHIISSTHRPRPEAKREEPAHEIRTHGHWAVMPFHVSIPACENFSTPGCGPSFPMYNVPCILTENKHVLCNILQLGQTSPPNLYNIVKLWWFGQMYTGDFFLPG